jgi:hypothetical protein
MVQNFAFDTDTQLWIEETNLQVDWDEADGEGRANSGSILVQNRSELDRDGSLMMGARQCLPVTGGSVYQFAAQVLVPEQSGQGSAGLQVIFYSKQGCTEHVIDQVMSNFVAPGPDWEVVERNERAPNQAASAMLRLVVIKPFRSPPFKAHFDNVLAHGP